MPDVLVDSRRRQLVGALEASGGRKVVDLAALLRVSRATVRRDLIDLERRGLVVRVRGGALPADTTPPSPALLPAETHVIGLIVPSASYYYPQVIDGVQAEAARRGARVVIGLSGYAHEHDAQRIDELHRSGASGLLIASPHGHGLAPDTYARLAATGLPFALIERRPPNPFLPCEFAVTDHRQGVYAAIRHFAELGHDRVALFTNGSPTAALLRQGHSAAVRHLGLTPGVPVVDSGRPAQGSTEAAPHYDAFLDACRDTGVRAALVHSDHDAIELLRRMASRGLRAPDDLALIAYDDEIAELADVPLTAVAPPKHAVGSQAAALLLDRLDHAARGTTPAPVRQVHLQPSLVVRASCGARPTARTAPPPSTKE
ncbi:LacI family DNA-binding transcriptional regulator [Streptomyces justiciae]|uniref:Substrate-binding domain-containing protein n=1 Tax=Streptomyces justiciae TaxID=2780140 RepID=A0ABU3LK90_9ACTN|nr:substrate-binding domain-containing protein [Streptomyces justiciae]MDT7839664.1 substrate-binding domain-containing protein [Streptomyces justiciae]